MAFPKFSFKNFGEKLQQALMRFPITIAAILTFAVLMIIQIHNNFKDLFDERLWWMLGLTILLSLAFYLFAENRIGCLLKNILNVLLIACVAWFTFTLQKPVVEAEIIRMLVLGVSFGAAVFFAPFITGKRPLAFWNYVLDVIYQLITAYVFAGVLMAGLSLALLSLDKLFGMNIPDNSYGYLSVLCFVLFGSVYFLSSMPRLSISEEEKTVEFPKIYKILGLYILLPILGIYILILYVYLAKIIVTWELPNGWVSWLVSILGIVGYLTISLIHPIYLKGENKPAKLFTRFFPIILLPLLILMFVGIMRRLSDYGITINRLYVLLLNLWLFGVSIYIFLTKTRQVKWIYISFAAIAFLFSVGPWSVFSITKHTLKSELTRLYTEAKPFISDQKNPEIKSLDTAKKKRLYDITRYLKQTYGKESVKTVIVSVFGKDVKTDNLISVPAIYEDEKTEKYFSLYSREESIELPITGYNTFIKLSKTYNDNYLYKNDSLSVMVKNSQIEIIQQDKVLTVISLEKLIKNSFENDRNEIKPEDAALSGTNYKLLVFSLEGKRKAENKEVKITNMNAIILLK
ncbi:MAG TPA: DUF4153 domain-containing protein [Paludibacteraceae bacterium]|nr:DUF4153 domain-containing protein [Paludibacteraceae bacterium]